MSKNDDIPNSERVFVSLNSSKSPELVGVVPGFEHLAESLNYIDSNGNNISVYDVIKSGEPVDVVVPNRKISQPVYDAMVKNTHRNGDTHVQIPPGIDTSDLSLDMSIPHNFVGHNIIGMVPPGSDLGDHVTVHNGAHIRNCKIGVEAVIGDDVVIEDSYVGVKCEAGSDVALINCIIDAGFASPSAELVDRCRINMGFSVGHIDHYKNDNVMLPGFYIDSITRVGNDNVTLTQGPFPVPDEQGRNNVRVGVSVDKLPRNINDKNLYSSVEKWKASEHAVDLWERVSSNHEMADKMESSNDPGMGV